MLTGLTHHTSLINQSKFAGELHIAINHIYRAILIAKHLWISPLAPKLFYTFKAKTIKGTVFSKDLLQREREREIKRTNFIPFEKH